MNPQGQVIFPENISNVSSDPLDLFLRPTFTGLVLTPAPDDVTKVPEPGATAGLLGFGIVSTALLRKRNKRLKGSISHSKTRE